MPQAASSRAELAADPIMKFLREQPNFMPFHDSSLVSKAFHKDSSSVPGHHYKLKSLINARSSQLNSVKYKQNRDGLSMRLYETIWSLLFDSLSALSMHDPSEHRQNLVKLQEVKDTYEKSLIDQEKHWPASTDIAELDHRKDPHRRFILSALCLFDSIILGNSTSKPSAPDILPERLRPVWKGVAQIWKTSVSGQGSSSDNLPLILIYMSLIHKSHIANPDPDASPLAVFFDAIASRQSQDFKDIESHLLQVLQTSNAFDTSVISFEDWKRLYVSPSMPHSRVTNRTPSLQHLVRVARKLPALLLNHSTDPDAFKLNNFGPGHTKFAIKVFLFMFLMVTILFIAQFQSIYSDPIPTKIKRQIIQDIFMHFSVLVCSTLIGVITYFLRKRELRKIRQEKAFHSIVVFADKAVQAYKQTFLVTRLWDWHNALPTSLSSNRYKQIHVSAYQALPHMKHIIQKTAEHTANRLGPAVVPLILPPQYNLARQSKNHIKNSR